WTWRAAIMPRRRNETMIVGTDPVLSVLVAISWRLLRPRAKIIHWCHDLYPHAAVAESMIKADSLAVRALNFALRIAYRRCDVIADLGICMRRLLIEANGETVGRQQTTGDVQVAEPLPFVAVADNDINGSDRLWAADAMTRGDEHSV